MENIDHLIQRHIQQHLECHQPNLLEAVLELLKPNEAYKAADMTIQNASSTHQTAADQQVRLQSLQQVIQETDHVKFTMLSTTQSQRTTKS